MQGWGRVAFICSHPTADILSLPFQHQLRDVVQLYLCVALLGS